MLRNTLPATFKGQANCDSGIALAQTTLQRLWPNRPVVAAALRRRSVRELMLKEALEADGFEVPPRSAEDRLKELRARDRVR